MQKTPFLMHWNSWKQCSESVNMFLFDWLWANTAPTLNTAFSLTNVLAKWLIHWLQISSTPLLSYATSIYVRPTRVSWSFSGQLLNLGDLECLASSVSVRLFNVSIPPLNCCFQWSSLWNNINQAIALLELFFFFFFFFSHQKAMF